MAEFTDTVNEVDNIDFTDEQGATDAAPELPKINDTTTDAGVSPPVLSNNSPDVTNTDTTESAEGETTENQDIYTLLVQLQTEQQEYETQVLETAKTLTEQAKNTLSCLVLTIVLIGFLSGLVLARSVWRKF